MHHTAYALRRLFRERVLRRPHPGGSTSKPMIRQRYLTTGDFARTMRLIALDPPLSEPLSGSHLNHPIKSAAADRLLDERLDRLMPAWWRKSRPYRHPFKTLDKVLYEQCNALMDTRKRKRAGLQTGTKRSWLRGLLPLQFQHLIESLRNRGGNQKH